MGNRVMDMEQVQRLSFKYFEHLRGKRQCIRRMIEQGIRRDLHLVEEDMWIVQIHADRRGVAYEMNIMATRGKLLAEFRSNDAGTAVSGIAGYADAHGRTFPETPERGSHTQRAPCC